MPARRFFVGGVHHSGEPVLIDGSDAHKILNVLRLRGGDEIEVVDSGGTVFAALLETSGDLRALLGVELGKADGARVAIDVAQGIPKGAKMDYIVEKLSELGVRALLPLQSERTIARDVSTAKVERWRRLAKSAAQQSGRPDLLAVEDPISFAQLCALFASYDAVLFLWEVAEQQALRDVLPGIVAGASRLLVVVGPEGGFSHTEAEAAVRAHAHLLSLGSRILRTETAALAFAAVLNYLID
jgi:16S rRNA (uracil1498-N3)-methyltransferase